MGYTTAELAKSLRNIGPVCAEHLVQVGLDTPEKLRALGAEAAFEKIQTTLKCPHNLNYLYALEGAIDDCDWRAIEPVRKKELQDFMTERKRRD